MKLSDIMGNAGLSIYAEIALVIFLVVFVAICWWIFRPGAKSRWQQDAKLPFDEGSVPSHGSDAGVTDE